jgi:hypothetical protein
MEEILNRGLAYISGPQWLYENVLKDKWVLAVAGTHGKTTTSAMLAWILEDAGLNPGYLVGGVPMNFGVSARLTESPFFVIEADEYDTAFFDKRSKFVHYRPRTAILNNLEYDHADIFPDLAAIETQFHHLVRTVPGNGRVIANGGDNNVLRVLGRGCWSEVEYFAGPGFGWKARAGRRRPLRGQPGRCPGRPGHLGPARRAQPGQRPGSHRCGTPRRRLGAGGHRGAGPLRERQAAPGDARHGQRHHRLRRFRASPDGHRNHPGRPALAGRDGAHPGGAGAAFQHHEAGRHEGSTGGQPQGRAARLLLQRRSGLGCRRRAAAPGRPATTHDDLAHWSRPSPPRRGRAITFW